MLAAAQFLLFSRPFFSLFKYRRFLSHTGVDSLMISCDLASCNSYVSA